MRQPLYRRENTVDQTARGTGGFANLFFQEEGFPMTVPSTMASTTAGINFTLITRLMPRPIEHKPRSAAARF
jgi:hypothetical protein